MDAQSDCIVRHTVCSSLVCWKCEGHFARTCNSKLVCDEALRFALSYHWEEQSTTRLDSVNAKTTVLLGYVRVKLIVLLLFAYKARKIGMNVQKTCVHKRTPRSIYFIIFLFGYLFKN